MIRFFCSKNVSETGQFCSVLKRMSVALYYSTKLMRTLRLVGAKRNKSKHNKLFKHRLFTEIACG